MSLPSGSWTGRTNALWVASLVALLTIAVILTQSRAALLWLIVDGMVAIGLLAVCALAGAWAVPLLRLRAAPRWWRLLIGVTIGLGIAAALVLGFGLLGVLSRRAWLAILTTLGVAGAAALVRMGRRSPHVTRHQESPGPAPHSRCSEEPLPHPERRCATSWASRFRLGRVQGRGSEIPLAHGRGSDGTGTAGRFAWLWVLAVPFLALTALVCVVPPGFLWAEEGLGYDVLEYHLELPKEYLQQGRITYTPHNVYGSFPSNAEVLYLLCMIVQNDAYLGAASANILNALFAGLVVFAAYVIGRDVSPRVGVVTAVVAAGCGWLTYLSGVAYVENLMLLFAMVSAGALIRAAGEDEAVWRWTLLSGLASGLACGCKYTAIVMVALPIGVAMLLLPQPSWSRRIGRVGVFGVGVVAAFSPWLIKNVAQTGNPIFPLANTVFQAYPEGWGAAESRHFAKCHEPGPDESPLADRLRLFWERIPGDPEQRFGPLVFLLAAVRLVSRRRTRVDLILGVIFVVQAASWLFFTHLYARFAVPMLVPLVLLAGRSWGVSAAAAWKRAFVAVLVAGTGFNAFMITKLYAEHLYASGHKQPLEGADQFFLQGMGMGHEHLSVINGSLPPDSRILMIGDAKAFYFQRRVDYCVVFNRSPFVDAVRRSASPSEIVDWLWTQGYTHVLVNWAEIGRLRSSRYGFPLEIKPELFSRLEGAGLARINVFETGEPSRPYAVLYSVPR